MVAGRVTRQLLALWELLLINRAGLVPAVRTGAAPLDAAPAGAGDLSLRGVVLEGTGRRPQLAVDAVAVTVLCDAASLALPTSVAGPQAPALSLPGVVLIVLGRDDFHL